MTGPLDLPVVSFVIPVRDDADRLDRCLQSIVRNEYPADRVDIIVMDHGSRDRSREVARRHGATVIQMSKGVVAELRNRGAVVARGAIIAFVDADHEIDPHWIRQAVIALAREDVAATGAPYLPSPDANWIQRCYDGLRRRAPSPEDVDWLGSGNLAVKRAVFHAAGGFDRSLDTCEDVDLCNRIRRAGYRIVCDPEMRSVHFGDPATLGALFYGELWRGRNNLRVTLRGPWTFAHLRSLLVPLADAAALAVALLTLVIGWLPMAAAAVCSVLALASIRARVIIRRAPAPGLVATAQAFAVALVYDLARTLALVTRGSHRLRRSAEKGTNDPASAHS